MLFPLLATLLASVGLAAAATAASPHAQLVKLAASPDGVIKLDEKTFNLLTASKRNWTSSIHFTALDPKRRCVPCKEFEPNWRAVAKAWTTLPAAQRDTHFFATVDFDDASTVFQSLGISSAPVVHIYPATEGPNKPANGRTSSIKMDFTNGFDAGPLAEQLNRHMTIPIPYRAPIDWAVWGTRLFGALAFAFIIRFISPILQSKWTWAALTVIVSLVMTSGYMFVQIRGMPYTGPNGSWIAGGFQNQYGQEVQVVAMIYGLLAASFLMLTLVIPYQTSPARQRTQVYLWSAILIVIFSILISFFRVKNRGYPFRLLL